MSAPIVQTQREPGPGIQVEAALPDSLHGLCRGHPLLSPVAAQPAVLPCSCPFSCVCASVIMGQPMPQPPEAPRPTCSLSLCFSSFRVRHLSCPVHGSDQPSESSQAPQCVRSRFKCLGLLNTATEGKFHASFSEHIRRCVAGWGNEASGSSLYMELQRVFQGNRFSL